MKLKNYTSASGNTFAVIQKCLVDHKAKQIIFEYDSQGRATGLLFSLEIEGKTLGFRLPARLEKVEGIFYQSKKTRYSWEKPAPLSQKEKDQAYRTAWANIRDWITAQMALIDTEMVKLEEVFLPYLLSQGKTFFEVIQERGYLLPGGEKDR
jgi:hypothetical protein